jgi:hypothetical protein
MHEEGGLYGPHAEIRSQSEDQRRVGDLASGGDRRLGRDGWADVDEPLGADSPDWPGGNPTAVDGIGIGKILARLVELEGARLEQLHEERARIDQSISQCKLHLSHLETLLTGLISGRES